MNKTVLYQLNETEKEEFMMSYVIATKKDNVIIVDGGRPENMPLLKKCVNGRHISAWILTHAHSDHISGFMSEMAENACRDFDIEKIYYNFPPYELVDTDRASVPDYDYLKEELDECLPEFDGLLPLFKEKTHIAKAGEVLTVDELKIEFLYSYEGGMYENLMNDASLVFKVTGENKTVLFLGDLGPSGGDVLLNSAKDKLKSDICQMAHHGHMNCSMEVYAEIMPEVCLWSAPMWLYNEPELPRYLADRKKLLKVNRHRMYGEALTRKWMDILGAKTHLVSGEGMHEVEI